MVRSLLTVIGVSVGLQLGGMPGAWAKSKPSPAARALRGAGPLPMKMKAPAAIATPARKLSTGLLNLGHLDKPGARLAQKRFELVPGGTLRFATSESAVRGLGRIQAPQGALVVRRTVLKAPKPGLAGGRAEIEYRLTLPLNAKPGVYKVSTGGAFQVRQDPAWAFSFELHVGKRRIGEPRPL